jgi:hypothetical protein
MLLIAGIDEIDGLKPASSLHKKTPDTKTPPYSQVKPQALALI